MRAWPLPALVAASLLAVALPVTGASAAGEAQVSGLSPYAQCAPLPTASGTNFPGTVVEPSVAVNPATTSSGRVNAVAVWQQDRWTDGASRGLVAGYSFDSGKTWKENPLPFSSCANGGIPYERASDPWVSIGPDGVVYASSLSVSFGPETSDSAVAVSTSTSGGRIWSSPKMVIADGNSDRYFNDKESVTADPVRRGVAYVVWDRQDGATNSSSTWFSETADGGKHWTTARALYVMPSNNQTVGNVVVVDPRKDTLYDVFAWVVGDNAEAASLALQRSTDGGRTWSAPQIAAVVDSVGVRDPNTGQALRVGETLPAVAVDPRNGTLYLAWEDARFDSGAYDEIALSSSVDGGRTWTLPVRVNRPTGRAAFTPAVAVDGQGRVGIAFYDFRNLAGERATLPTDDWLRISTNGGRSFSREVHLGGSFDMLRAPQAGGYFVGDYQALAGLKRSFLAVFAMTTSGPGMASSALFARRATG